MTTKVKRQAYKAYINSPTWKAIRARVIFRDGGQCRRCGTRYHLEVHHLTYVRFGGRERLSDLITLCEACHEAEHDFQTAQRRA
jgi:5-methylcytosine-specific restriction endonuclease McrA